MANITEPLARPLTLPVVLALSDGGWPVATDEGGGDPTPLVSSDFKNGVYAINGVSKTFGEMWEEDSENFTTFDPNRIVAGVGYQLVNEAGGDLNDGVVATAELFAAFSAGPVTVVFEYTLVHDSIGSAALYMNLIDFPGWNETWEASVRHSPPTLSYTEVSDYDVPPVKATISTDVTGAHKIAATLSDAGSSISIDGGSAVTSDPMQENAARTDFSLLLTSSILSGESTITLLNVIIYDAVDASDLPALSA